MRLKNWNDCVVKKSISIEMAMRILNQTSSGILLVIGEDKNFLGIVTDGDIRRGLINGFTPDTTLNHVINSNPIVISSTVNKSKINALFMKHNITTLPVVDSKKLVGLETLFHIKDEPKISNTLMLMAGGFGKRLLPLTKNCPKPMLSFGRRPFLEIIIEKFKDQGFRDFLISTHYLAEKIQNHFGNGEKYGVSVRYVNEKEPGGTAGSLCLLKELSISYPIVLLNSDILTNLKLADVIKKHNDSKSDLTICVRKYYQKNPYGVLLTKNKKVIGIEEKPVNISLISSGIYIISKKAIEEILKMRCTSLDMPDFIDLLIKKDFSVSFFEIDCYWRDIGTFEDLETARDEYARGVI